MADVRANTFDIRHLEVYGEWGRNDTEGGLGGRNHLVGLQNLTL